MIHKKLLLASLLAASGLAAQTAHAVNWVGTADYTAAPGSTGDEDVVGPFTTYDAGVGVVLLEVASSSSSVTNYNGFYQSYITGHEDLTGLVPAPGLNTTYQLTLVANFTESVQNNGTITVNSGGTFALYLDTDTSLSRAYSFSGDSGFTDGDAILTGTITGGAGTATNFGSMVFGATTIDVQVDSFNAAVFEPDTITNAGGIFTLQLNSPFTSPFLSTVTSVQGNPVNALAGDLLFAADGNVALAVPEAETYAMMLAGLGLVGFMARRRAHAIA